MNSIVFENILVCVDNMNEAQTLTLLQAIMKKKQMTSLMIVSKHECDKLAQTYGDEPLTDEEWEYVDDAIMNDTSVADIIVPFGNWVKAMVMDVKQKHMDLEEVDIDSVEDVPNNAMLSESISHNSSIEFFEHLPDIIDCCIKNRCNMKDVRLSRTTDELAVIACPPSAHCMPTKRTHSMSSKFDFWLLSLHAVSLY